MGGFVYKGIPTEEDLYCVKDDPRPTRDLNTATRMTVHAEPELVKEGVSSVTKVCKPFCVLTPIWGSLIKGVTL